MSLAVIATPIGNSNDLGIRALQVLREADLIITEERKIGTRLLRFHGIVGKSLEELNEHSGEEEIKSLADACKIHSVALISDAGTPGFCDPGSRLVKICRKRKIKVFSVPGPSSLMALLSICGQRIDQFFFRGFISANTEERRIQLEELKSTRVPVVLMDTPYRLRKLLREIEEILPRHSLVLGHSLSQAEETFLEGTASEVLKLLVVEKAEFVLIILPHALK